MAAYRRWAEPLESLARELDVTAARLIEWRDRALVVSEDFGPILAELDVQPFSSVAQHHGMSSSMRLLGRIRPARAAVIGL